MKNRKYKLTRKTLGDVFGGKEIVTDTLDIVAYILREEKDPNSGVRRYRKVTHGYFDRDNNDIAHQNVEYPPFPISACDMNIFHPRGRYMVKVVSRNDKSRSFGSVAFFNDGDGYFTDEELSGSQPPQRNVTIRTSDDNVSAQIVRRLDQIEKKLMILLNSRIATL